VALWSGVLEAYDVPKVFVTLQKAEEAYREFRLPEARTLYQGLVKLPALAERKQTLRLARLRLGALAVEHRLAKGEWVRLTESERKLLWQPDWGGW
jgi:16S rRNA U516 pseudouridylate synthase RsuA-like enzyme